MWAMHINVFFCHYICRDHDVDPQVPTLPQLTQHDSDPDRTGYNNTSRSRCSLRVHQQAAMCSQRSDSWGAITTPTMRLSWLAGTAKSICSLFVFRIKSQATSFISESCETGKLIHLLNVKWHSVAQQRTLVGKLVNIPNCDEFPHVYAC